MISWPLWAALIAAGTALFIAFVLYPWQKEQDRKQQHQTEKRNAYREFAREINSYFARAALGKKFDQSEKLNEHYLRVVSASADLIIYAPKEVIEVCQSYSMSVFELSELVGALSGRKGYELKEGVDYKTLYKKVKSLRKAAMISLRCDLNDKGLGDPKAAMDTFFVLTEDLSEDHNLSLFEIDNKDRVDFG